MLEKVILLKTSVWVGMLGGARGAALESGVRRFDFLTLGSDGVVNVMALKVFYKNG